MPLSTQSLRAFSVCLFLTNSGFVTCINSHNIKLTSKNNDLSVNTISTEIIDNELSNGTLAPDEEGRNSILWQILDRSLPVITITGFVANMATAITLVAHSETLSPIVCTLLRHQSILDAMACLSGAILIIQPANWIPGGWWVLDIIICHAWNSQTVFWWFLCGSICNLVTLAFERYIAVCKPLYHVQFTRRRFYLGMGGCYFLNAALLVGSSLQIQMIDGECVSEFLLVGEDAQRYYKAYAVACFLYSYFIPTIFLCLFYGLVLITFHKRKKQIELGSSRVIDKATTQLTKTTIIVTVIFIICLSTLWLYLLSYLGVFKYKVNSILSKMCVFASSINSASNPFVYGLLLPTYRRSLQLTFCSCFVKARAKPQVKA